MSGRRYLPLRAYGLVGDGRRTAALVGRNGSVDWWCLPRLEDASVFARLLDDRAGGFCSAAPAGAIHDSPLWESSQRYRPRTNVLVTEFRGADAVLRVDDVVPPGEEAGPALLRRLTARGGPVEAEVRFAPRFDYARRRPVFTRRDGGWLATAEGDAGGTGPDGASLALAAGPGMSLDADGRRHEVSGRFRVEPDHPRWLALRWGAAGVRPARPGRCEERLGRAVAHWRKRAAPEGEGPLEEAAARSSLLLELLAVGPEGAVAAAPTTSLPGRGSPRDPRRTYLPRDGAAGGAPVRLADELRRAGEAARGGRAGEARERAERVASLAGPTGLLAEAADPGAGRLLGDYPWAPAHAELVRAARAVAEAEGAPAPPGVGQKVT